MSVQYHYGVTSSRNRTNVSRLSQAHDSL